MTSRKDFKRLVRGRMARTGESYTAARRHFADQSDPPMTPPPAASPDYATLAGMRDSALAAKTGCGWATWVFVLDKVGAAQWPHREIAAYVQQNYKTSSWWSQTVTVGYERIKGLRAIGQKRDGGFEVTKSKILAVPLRQLYRSFRDKRLRIKWLPGVALTIRTAVRDTSMRIIWPDGTLVQVGFLGKGRGKAQVAVQQGRFGSKEQAQEMKRYWVERLQTLERLVAK